MNNYKGVRILATLMLLIASLAFGLGSVSHAYAEDKGSSTSLPQTKEPNSVRFDMTGKVTTSTSLIEPSTSTITGGGAVSGKDFEESITLQLDSALAPGQSSGLPQSITVEVKQIQGRTYFKFGALLGGDPDAWYYSDDAALTGSTGTSITQPNLTSLGDKYTVTREGQETLDGAPVTKYRIDVDMADLLGDLGQTSGSSSTLEATSVYYLWVGDADQYLHKYSAISTLNSSYDLGENNKLDLNTASEVTITFKDFDTPIAITAPANAVPFEDFLKNGSTTTESSLSSIASIVGMPTGMPVGMPVGMPAGVPVVSPNTGTGLMPSDMGMPQTGDSNATPWVLLILALASVTLGTGLKLMRKPEPIRIKN